MRIRFPGGREIEAIDPSAANLLHLMELKQQTRAFTDDGKGLGMHGLSAMRRRSADYRRAMEAEAAAAKEEGRDPVELDPPDDADLWMAVLLFLSRRAAGDRVTFLEAADVCVQDVVAIPDPGDEAPEKEDPMMPGGGGPATREVPDVPTAEGQMTGRSMTSPSP